MHEQKVCEPQVQQQEQFILCCWQLGNYSCWVRWLTYIIMFICNKLTMCCFRRISRYISVDYYFSQHMFNTRVLSDCILIGMHEKVHGCLCMHGCSHLKMQLSMRNILKFWHGTTCVRHAWWTKVRVTLTYTKKCTCVEPCYKNGNDLTRSNVSFWHKTTCVQHAC